MTKVAFRLRRDGQTLARVESDDHIGAEAEIMFYARQHREDGEVTIQHNAEGHWKRFALLCQWPTVR